MKRVLALVVLCIVALSTAASAAQITYVDLIKRLTDLECLAVLPAPGEICAQASSYDRASAYDAKTGKYVGWDANGDWGGIVRAEGDKQVLAEIEGPGCIQRIWSAAPKDGHVRIYLDGAAEPVIDMPFKDYFDAKHEPFVYPSLVNILSQGCNCYVPIPFQKSCKVVADKDWGAYYHFTYTQYPKDTVVPTFKGELASEEKAALEAADKFLGNSLGTDPAGSRASAKTVNTAYSLKAGRSAKFSSAEPCAITGLGMSFDTKKYSPDTLRNIILRICWDGEKKPSVEAPICDFFGTAPGVNLYKSLPLGVTQEGGYSYWYMPCSSYKAEIINLSGEEFDFTLDLTTAQLAQPVAELGRFHAKWHRDAFLPKEPERWIDWPMLKTEGRGRFLGVMLEVWNPKGGWWGEGDEKFFVDGEKLPSTFGTGSEDYFGYAWCNPTPFFNAFHNQTHNDGNNKGHVSVNRWHIVDNVPFQKSFEADIEKYFRNDRPTLFASTVYWYQAPGSGDPYAKIAKKDLTGWYVEPARRHTVAGGIEGEDMKTLSLTGGSVSMQDMNAFPGGKWSSGGQLWWVGPKPGDELNLALPVKNAGRYEVKMTFTKAADYGMFRLMLDGKKLGLFDFYNDGVVSYGPVSFGSFDMAAGEHKITAVVLGANKNAAKGYLFGLDLVQLVAVK